MTTPLDLEVTRRYSAAQQELRDKLGAVAKREWAKLPSYNEANIPAFIEAMTAPTDLVRGQTSTLSAGYLNHFTGSRTLPSDLKEIDAETWRQPFMSTWSALASGETYEAAVAAGEDRAVGTMGDIVTETARETTEGIGGGEPAIIGWDWVAEPDACPWCIERAGVTWDSTEQDVFSQSHDNCRCDITPVTADSAPGQELNAENPDVQGDGTEGDAAPKEERETLGQVKERTLKELADRSDYTVDELRAARSQLAELRASMRAEAADTKHAAEGWLGGGRSPLTGLEGPASGPTMQTPPKAVRKVSDFGGGTRWVRGGGGEWDWLDQMEQGEFRRLQKAGRFDKYGQSPDQIHHIFTTIGQLDDSMAALDEAMLQWRTHVSLSDAAGAVARGRPIGAGHIVEAADIAPNLAAEGWNVDTILAATGPEMDAEALLEIAGKEAERAADYAERELFDGFRSNTGDRAYEAVEGPAPWKMTEASYANELLEIEDNIGAARNAGLTPNAADVRRWHELVPIAEQPGTTASPEDLYRTVTDLARKARLLK